LVCTLSRLLDHDTGYEDRLVAQLDAVQNQDDREMKSWIIIAVLTVLLRHELGAALFNINNEKLSVSYEDATGVFSVAERAARRPFLVDGKLEGVPRKVGVNRTRDPIFGEGEKILVAQTDGSAASLELYQGLPFLLVRKELHNNGDVTTDLQKVVPVTFGLDLGTPADKLRTLGTAGLTAPDKHPGSYLFLTLADPATRRGVVAGWLTEDRGSGVLFSRLKDKMVEFKAQIDYGHLHIPPEKSVPLETLAVGLFDDARIGEESFADAIKAHYGIKLRPQLAGHCTWYSEVGGLTDKAGGAGSSNEKDVAKLAAFAARELKPYGFAFVQIDDGWQDGGKFNGPRRGFTRPKPDGPYAGGMAPVAKMIRSNGLIAGIWFLPFARNHQDPEYKDRQSWFMKRLDGSPYETEWGGTSLDLTHPEVQAYLKGLVKTLHGWGYDYFKMDGLWTGSVTEQIYVNDGYKDDNIGNHQPFYDPSKTGIEALRDGLKLVRKAAGPEVFFSGSCASQNMRSLAGAIGLVDAMRVGPDNGFEWQDYRNEVMHFEGGGIITGPIRGNRLYFLNGRVWWNDPDPCYVRPAVKLNHAQLLASWMAISGTFNLNSDWLPGLPAERLDIIKRCLPSHHATARPVDYFDSVMPSIWLLTATNQTVRRDVLGLYNWESETRFISYDAAKAGLDPLKTYHAFDFWGKSPLADFKGDFKFDVPAASCRIVAVRAAETHPVLVSTSRHVTQGVVDISAEKWEAASGTLSGISQIVGNDPYELRIAGLRDGSKWKLVSASSHPADATASHATSNETQVRSDGDWARVLISSKESRAISWSVRFTPESAPLEDVKGMRPHPRESAKSSSTSDL
jgi:hypothetical protein